MLHLRTEPEGLDAATETAGDDQQDERHMCMDGWCVRRADTCVCHTFATIVHAHSPSLSSPRPTAPHKSLSFFLLLESRLDPFSWQANRAMGRVSTACLSLTTLSLLTLPPKTRRDFVCADRHHWQFLPRPRRRRSSRTPSLFFPRASLAVPQAVVGEAASAHPRHESSYDVVHMHLREPLVCPHPRLVLPPPHPSMRVPQTDRR